LLHNRPFRDPRTSRSIPLSANLWARSDAFKISTLDDISVQIKLGDRFVSNTTLLVLRTGQSKKSSAPNLAPEVSIGQLSPEVEKSLKTLRWRLRVSLLKPLYSP